MIAAMASKIGMTQVFDDDGNLVPVTVMHIEQNIVLGKKSVEKDGYNAIVAGIKDKKEKSVTKAYKGQFAEGITPKKIVREFRDFSKDCEIGSTLGVEIFDGVRYVDVCGISKGKGFAGVVRRWHFEGGRKTHGSKFHREPGSTGQSTYPHKTFKNVKLPGRMGRERVTEMNLRVVRIDAEKQLILVKGAVPGVNGRIVTVRAAVKK
jgi:large subunit ribosomal protein L3